MFCILGKIFLNLVNRGPGVKKVPAGARLAQLLVTQSPEVEIQLVDDLPDTGRTKGFGALSGP